MEVIRQFSDPELVDNLKANRKLNESVKFLYRSHFESLSWYVLNNQGSRQDAEDIFQEAVVSFIDLVQKNKFRGESSIKTFLYSLNRHIWLNELKRRGRALQREMKYEKGRDQSEMDVSHQVAGREAKLQVMNLVNQLGEICKKILVMFYYESLPMKEILQNLDYENEQVVRNKKYKCLKQLEQLISAQPELKEHLKALLPDLN